MTKTDAIAAILKLNPGASPMFLAGFSNDDLLEYLGRLGGSSRTSRFLDADCCLVPENEGRAGFAATDCMS